MKTRKYKIGFHYEGLTTSCSIFNNEDGQTLVAGTVILYYKDTYDKEKARRYALARAMKVGGFTKEQRAEVWEEYRVSKPGGRWASGTVEEVKNEHASL